MEEWKNNHQLIPTLLYLTHHHSPPIGWGSFIILRVIALLTLFWWSRPVRFWDDPAPPAKLLSLDPAELSDEIYAHVPSTGSFSDSFYQDRGEFLEFYSSERKLYIKPWTKVWDLFIRPLELKRRVWRELNRDSRQLCINYSISVLRVKGRQVFKMNHRPLRSWVPRGFCSLQSLSKDEPIVKIFQGINYADKMLQASKS